MNLIALLVYVIILALIFSVIWWGISQVAWKPPFDMVIRVIFALIVVLVLVSLLMGALPLPSLHMR